MLDYVVVKLPRLPFDKFISAKRTLTTQMKATGEVMSICDNFEGALMKAIRSLEQHVDQPYVLRLYRTFWGGPLRAACYRRRYAYVEDR